MTRDAVAGETPASSATCASVGTDTAAGSTTVPVGDTRKTPFRAETPSGGVVGALPNINPGITPVKGCVTIVLEARFVLLAGKYLPKCSGRAGSVTGVNRRVSEIHENS